MRRERKFVITTDKFGKSAELNLGYQFFHRDLVSEGEVCLGGGMWNIDFEKKEIVLYGSSSDFGKPNKKNIENAVKNFTPHNWWQFGWICSQVYEDAPEDAFDNMGEKYKFVINY